MVMKTATRTTGRAHRRPLSLSGVPREAGGHGGEAYGSGVPREPGGHGGEAYGVVVDM
ncbi:hypothetical protein [Streptosporangium sp. NBC_01756]|uniref:hypothetical protein n=1 Tax=Streptosporangium sp. NBC_01756 TaxID=2975950 RepID=UPI002DD9A0E6|nr:hypothetical protein [Streptosporangium sp. NBC_01756]WSC83178.1 hypothetical protein OIE48_22435 [Streptosporangium sp. NBC_01756]